MEYFKKNKLKCLGLLAVVLFVLAVILCLILIVNPNGGNGVYGNRLTGIENVKITDSMIKDIKESVNSYSKVTDVSYYLKGRLMKFTVNVEGSIDSANLEKYTDAITDELEDKYLEFYDIQVLFQVKDGDPIYANRKKGDKTEFSFTIAQEGSGEASE